MTTRRGSTRTAAIDISVNTVSQATGIARRLTATNEIHPAMMMPITAKASRSMAIAAVVISGALRSSSSTTFSGSPAMPRTVKKLIASAASLTRKRRTKPGRASSGKEMDHPHVRSRCHMVPGIRMTGSASPSRAALSIVSWRSM
jgi:hypothetical protein